MNTLANPPSPTPSPAHLPSGDAPPTPPNDLLDDIYGSAPSSPHLSHTTLLAHHHNHDRDEILSDLPSRQRALDTDAYREGLADNKGQYVQEGFDEGYSLGANLGQRVGYVLGVLQGLCSATQNIASEEGRARYEEVSALSEKAKADMKIEELLGQKWIDEEGIWKWNVAGEDEEPTFREVAAQHPVIMKWMEEVRKLAKEWKIDLETLSGHEDEVEGEQS